MGTILSRPYIIIMVCLGLTGYGSGTDTPLVLRRIHNKHWFSEQSYRPRWSGIWNNDFSITAKGQ